MNDDALHNDDRPFSATADLFREFRGHWIAEAGYTEVTPGQFAGPMLGAISALITAADRLQRMLDQLKRADPDGYAAFQRALKRM